MEKASKDLELILKYFPGIPAVQQQQLDSLGGLYTEWNSKINVVSRKDIESLYEKHVLHSLSIAAVTGFSPGARIVDIGTGGGFPGIPLAILFPDAHFHLTDSIGKKIKVVDDIVSAIGLANVTTQHTRVEDIRGRRFDYAVSRAVAPLHELWNWSRPLLPAKGVNKKTQRDVFPGIKEPLAEGLICLKGGDLTGEMARIDTCKAVKVEIFPLFPEDWFREKFVVYVPA